MTAGDSLLKTAVKRIEQGIIRTLIILMSILLVLATIQLAYQVVVSVLNSSTFVMDLDVLMDLFGVFMLVLIGIELLDTIKVYFKEHVIHVEVVMLVAIIAIARKIILVDFGKYSALEVLAVAAIVLALAAGYYLIKKSGGCDFWPSEPAVREVVIEEKTRRVSDQDGVVERSQVTRERRPHHPDAAPGTDVIPNPRHLDPPLSE